MSGLMHPPPTIDAESGDPKLALLDAVDSLRFQAFEVAAAAALYEPELELDDVHGWRGFGRDLERVLMSCTHDAARSSP